MASNKIVYNGKTYTGDFSIMSGNMFLENSLANDELTVDTLSATIENSVETGTKFIPKGSSGMLSADKKMFYVLPIIRVLVDDLSQYIYGATVLYYRDDVLMGKFYMSSVKRVSKFQFEISCVSAIGLLDNTKHYGGVYDGTIMKDLLADIIGGIIPYTLDPIFLNLPVFGWLPVATRRENLHQLLFAEGATIKKDANGDLVFTYLKSGAATEIGDDRIFMGGTVDYATQVDTVIVIEHSYIAYENQEPVSLYEDFVPDQTITTPNGSIVSGVLVQFNDPTFALTIENGTILEQGANYAVLKSGGFCKLFGKPYSHTTRENIAKKPQSRSFVSIADNTATIDGATLVSLANGENVAKRALSYYGYAETTNADFVVNNERPGNSVTFNDPFGKSLIGFVQSMDISFGPILKARAKLVSGFLPTQPGNFYNNIVILSGSGQWAVPAGVTKVKSVLIGGGHGGTSGENGSDGRAGTREDSTKMYDDWEHVTLGTTFGVGGVGGKTGDGGEPGKVLEAEFSVSPGALLQYSCGIGGNGGSSGNKIQGSTGTASSISGKSSSNGSIYPSGYLEIFSGKIYAYYGKKNGITGGSGSGANEDRPYEYQAAASIVDEKGVRWNPGNTTENARAEGSISGKYNATITCSGGPGGGAAAGRNGNDGLIGEATLRESSVNASCYARTGVPGNGATPIPRAKQAIYGVGGDGGHGGGGGGGGGAASILHRRNTTTGFTISATLDVSDPGKGGLGGEGGKGGDGCIIIYY